MRETVKVKFEGSFFPVINNSIVLTRAQVEQAVKDLEEPVFQAGDIVEWSYRRGEYVVATGTARQIAVDRYGEVEGRSVWLTSGDHFYRVRPDTLTKIRSLAR